MPIVRATAGRWDDRRRILVAGMRTVVFSLGSALAATWTIFVLLHGLGGG